MNEQVGFCETFKAIPHAKQALCENWRPLASSEIADRVFVNRSPAEYTHQPTYIPMRTRPEYVKELLEGQKTMLTMLTKGFIDDLALRRTQEQDLAGGQGRIMAALDEQAKTIADWLFKLDGRLEASLKGVADLRGDLGVKIEALRYEVFCKNNPVPAKPKKPRKKR